MADVKTHEILIQLHHHDDRPTKTPQHDQVKTCRNFRSIKNSQNLNQFKEDEKIAEK